MAYTAWSVVFGEQPSAAKWNILGTNDAGFKDGTNIDSSAITTAKIADSNVTGSKLATSAIKLGYNQVTTSTSATTELEITELATAVTIPAGGRDVKLTFSGHLSSNSANTLHVVRFYDGAVGSGTVLRKFYFATHVADIALVDHRVLTCRVSAPAPGSKTYRVSLEAAVSTFRNYADAVNFYSDFLVELI